MGRLAERPWLRIDAGFPDEPFLAGVEAEGKWRCVARLTSNAVLERRAEPYVADIVAKGEEREDQTHMIELGSYRAKTRNKEWSRQRRVVLVLEVRPDELMPHWFFLVTDATVEGASGLALLKRYASGAAPGRTPESGKTPWSWLSGRLTERSRDTWASLPASGLRPSTASP